MQSCRQGAIILDAQRQIQVVTPPAKELLGWESDQVLGMACSLVLDCRDAHGGSMCDRCGFAEALMRQEITQPQPVHMADACGGRQAVTMSFWYLPPAGNIYHPRVMAVLDIPSGATIHFAPTSGSVNENVVVWPGALSAHIRPP